MADRRDKLEAEEIASDREREREREQGRDRDGKKARQRERVVFDNQCRYSPFLCHYRNGHLTVVQYLVEKYSADVNLKDSYGRTPLHDACR